MIENVLRQLPAWALLYVPLCYISCNTMRYVDAPFYTFTEVLIVATYACKFTRNPHPSLMICRPFLTECL